MKDEEAQMRGLVEEAVGLKVLGAQVVRLKQDASLRSYFRIVLPGGAEGEDSWVVMRMPKEGLKQSEEGGTQPSTEELPFLNVHRYLQGLGMPVPAVFCFDEARGMMLLEDLGDTTLEVHLKQHPGALEASYVALTDLLAQLRARAEKAPSSDCLGFRREFDKALYMWELEHFREWGLDIWSTLPRTAADNAALLECFEALACRLAALPRGFSHRDFQSRNLMLKRGRWHLIDFQDALLAPRAYDLVALLRDSYIELEPDFVLKMIRHYITCFARHSGESMDEKAFVQEFELLTVQRKLKDAARFEYIARQKKNPGFLPFIPASLRYARIALSHLPELSGLQGLLSRWLPEFA
ncbi:MAG: phosphotransferase [Proteobacteria bacterium]|nr:phosphotransferase [Cystobacterineae bacterium]MCL2259158.1 phosphotransferase [Cystobacterineae bacterium]MCL2314299.1 phosphotransferase [Pseudomonadota bacterium]